jgi:voltage-gated potassium channel Kch
MLESLDGHVVVCGGGRTGRQVMEELMALGQEFVVIERDPQGLDATPPRGGFLPRHRRRARRAWSYALSRPSSSRTPS